MPVSFKLYRAGEVFEATYVIAGPYLTVTSAYGTRRTVLGLMRPTKLARGLLNAIIRDVTAITPIAPATFVIAKPIGLLC